MSLGRENRLANVFFTKEVNHLVITSSNKGYLISLKDDIYSIFNYEYYDEKTVLLNRDLNKVILNDNILELGFIDQINYSRLAYNEITFSPDYKYYSKINGKIIEIHNALTGELLHELIGHPETVLKTIFSTDGENLISLSLDRKIIIWNYKTGALLKFLQGFKGLKTDVALSPDGKYFFFSIVLYRFF